jgi:hypothetical protein
MLMVISGIFGHSLFCSSVMAGHSSLFSQTT